MAEAIEEMSMSAKSTGERYIETIPLIQDASTNANIRSYGGSSARLTSKHPRLILWNFAESKSESASFRLISQQTNAHCKLP